eukprot:306998-Rhodomonas_salina.1
MERWRWAEIPSHSRLPAARSEAVATAVEFPTESATSSRKQYAAQLALRLTDLFSPFSDRTTQDTEAVRDARTARSSGANTHRLVKKKTQRKGAAPGEAQGVGEEGRKGREMRRSSYA